MSLVIVGGACDERVAAAVSAFEAEGWAPAGELSGLPEADAVLATGDPAVLLEADALGIRYVLVHHGPDDGVPEGTYARAHHRVERAQLAGLARRLRSRDRLLVTCLAFAFKNGIPEGSAWVVDTRFLDNPYWVPALRSLDGRDPRVREFILKHEESRELMRRLEDFLGFVLPAYQRERKAYLTVAVGCTGGRHRSVALVEELKAFMDRLGFDATVAHRDLDRE